MIIEVINILLFYFKEEHANVVMFMFVACGWGIWPSFNVYQPKKHALHVPLQ